MAIAIDQLNVGNVVADSAGTTMALTTSNAVASGGFIVIVFGWYSTANPTLTDISGGSLTWTVDKQGGVGLGGNCAIASAQAPSGLSSGVTITGTFSGAGATGGRSVGASSFTGVATSSPVDGTPPAQSTVNGTTAWASNAATLTAGSLLIGTSYEFDSDFTSTPTSPSIEMFDINGGPGSFGHTAAYRIEASSGSYTVAGTWSSATDGLTLAVPYLASTGGGGSTIASPRQVLGPSYAAIRAASI